MFHNDVFKQSHDAAQARAPSPSDSGKSRTSNYLDILVSSQLPLSKMSDKHVNIYLPGLCKNNSLLLNHSRSAIRWYFGDFAHNIKAAPQMCGAYPFRRRCLDAVSNLFIYVSSVPHSLSKETWINCPNQHRPS